MRAFVWVGAGGVDGLSKVDKIASANPINKLENIPKNKFLLEFMIDSLFWFNDIK